MSAPASRADLPPRLGFGILDAGSVTVSGDTLKATYVLEGTPVHVVRWRAGQCEVEDHWQGELLGIGMGENLQQAVLQAFIHFEGRTDPRFQHLVRQITAVGNVAVWYPLRGEEEEGSTRVAFHPAGLLFGVRQPVPAGDGGGLRRARGAFEQAVRRGLLRRPADGAGHVLRLRPDGAVQDEPIRLLEGVTTLGLLVETVRLLASGGAIRPEKRYRLIVGEAGDMLPGQVRIESGREPGAQPDVAYLVMPKATSEDHRAAVAALRSEGPTVARSEA